MSDTNNENRLLNALKEIEAMCDNKTPKHEDVWRVAYRAIDRYNDSQKQENEQLKTTEPVLPIQNVITCFSEAVEDIDSNGLECGLEDLGITNRYEAMQYGFDQCKVRALEAIRLEGD